MCDKKNSVLFTDTKCVVLSLDFKLTDESHVLLKVPRKDNMYGVDLKNVIPQGGLTCLFEKATPDESNLWHKRLGHVNFKTMNKLVKGNLVRGLSSKLFEINQTCIACQKGNQHRASCIENLIDLKLKVIRCDNGIEFKNRVMNQLCEMKGRKPALSFMRPFGCPVTILNTIDHLGKFDGKADEGFFVGYSTNSKAFRVFNSRTRIVEENMHVQFSKNTPNIIGSGLNWLFYIDALTKSMNYKPVVARNQSNGNTCTKACDNACKAIMETVPSKNYILLPVWPADPLFSQSSKDSLDAGFKPSREEEKKDTKDPWNENNEVPSTEESRVNQEKDVSVNNTNTINTVSPTVNVAGIEDNVVDENIVYGCVDDLNMLEIGSYHLILVMMKMLAAEARLNHLDTCIAYSVQQKTHKDLDLSVSCFLSTRRNKKKRPLYEVQIQAPRAWYGNLCRLLIVVVTYLLDNGFQRGKIYKTLFIRRDKGDILLVQVYVDDIIFGSTKKSLCTEFEKIMHKKFQMSSMGELTFFPRLQVKQKEDGIFISQDKYVIEILKKFSFSDVKTASTPMETHKPLLKDADGKDVDEHLYRSMIGSLMYLTSLRLDIMCKFRRNSIVVANSTTEAEYIASSNYCGQVLWIQNQLLDYGYNFMQTKIHIDNESTICIVKNPVFHSKTKHIEIRHHFIKGSYEKKFIQMIKIHTDHNVADLLTKAFDVSRFQYLIASIGMLNLWSID
ncbi:putative ribonuclease H-like domain-containing protein [Tanacetum coccineum]